MSVSPDVVSRNLDLDAGIAARFRGVSGEGSLDPEGPAITGGRRQMFGYGYYRKKERQAPENTGSGDSLWIRLEQDTPVQRITFIDDIENDGFGWQYLGKYGRLYQGQPFDLTKEQFQPLFEMGGEHEFPLSQIIEMGWDVKAPRYRGLTDYSRPMRGREVTFPQLDAYRREHGGDSLDRVRCECGYRGRPLSMGGAEDLTRHNHIYHRTNANNTELARTLGKEMGNVLERITAGGDPTTSPQLADAIMALVAQNSELMARAKAPAPKGGQPAARTETPASTSDESASFAATLQTGEKE